MKGYEGDLIMNDYQKVSFEILKVFIDICEKLNLKYYLACGSVLGTVKYHGFIPWDDDIDVCLLRPDYEIFVREAPQYLPPYLFLQNYKTDPAFPSITSKIRDCRTTWIEKGVAHLDINHGIYLDVFPIDGYPKDIKAQKELEKRKMAFERVRALSYSTKYNPLSIRTNLVILKKKLFGKGKSSFENIREYEKLVSKYSPFDSEVWCNHGNWQGKLEYADKSQYGEGVSAIFEGIEVRIPEDYDAYLTQKYGDWRADLPLNKRNSGHDILIMDASKSYLEYIRKT